MNVPEWLAGFQAQFAAMLRSPLDRSTGTLRPALSAYDPRACDEAMAGRTLTARERLAVYNQQYWFRLFGLMASAFPLCARLVGHWHFNGLSTRFLLAHPPRGWNIDDVPGPFIEFLEREIESEIEREMESGRVPAAVPPVALLQGARIDAAWRRVFLAPPGAPYRPSPAEAARLTTMRLRPAEGVAVVEEQWPLLALRRSVMDDRGESAVALPPAHPEPRFSALVRTRSGIGELALEAREAHLFALLREHSLGVALARLEAACPSEEREQLPTRAREWLARSVRLGFWSGVEDA